MPSKVSKSKYASIVEKRVIGFDAPTWRWAKGQKNLSEAIRNLIRLSQYHVKRGRRRG